MNAPVTRAHRELAVLTMYPDCHPDSYMWVEFVGSENDKPYRTLARVAQALADAEARRPVLSMEQLKSGMYVRCVVAPADCSAYPQRCGYLYEGIESVHGPGVLWIWNMEFSGGRAEVPVRERDGYTFEIAEHTETKLAAFSIDRLIGIWTEINAYVVACGGTPPQPQDKSAAHWAATDKVQAYLKGQR